MEGTQCWVFLTNSSFQKQTLLQVYSIVSMGEEGQVLKLFYIKWFHLYETPNTQVYLCGPDCLSICWSFLSLKTKFEVLLANFAARHFFYKLSKFFTFEAFPYGIIRIALFHKFRERTIVFTTLSGIKLVTFAV